jgi:hypothetical protein
MSANTQSGGSKSSPRQPMAVPNRPIELPEGLWDRISQKAFELWKERGCRAGHDLEDWFDAEAVVMDEVHEARE